MGNPVGKQRPKFSSRGGFARAYTPSKTINYEKLVQETFEKECRNEFKPLYEGEVVISIEAIFEPPKSTKKKERKELIENLKPHLHKPDVDNIMKIILDALNGIAYKDDNQVCEASIYKHYGEESKVIVELIYKEDK